MRDRIYSDLGAELHPCAVCGYVTILRFNVCKKCDDALWLSQCSKKQCSGPEAHDIQDVKHIKALIKKIREKQM